MKTDLRQALRFLRRRPALSGSIVLTVALAVAATTVAFAIVEAVLLEPLPYESPDRLVAVWESNPRGEDRNVVSPANFLTWRDELESSFDAVASVLETSTTLLEDGAPERVGLVQASAAYFEMVGAETIAGRLYGEAEDAEGAAAVLVLSESFWRRRFAADPSVVGRTVQLGLRPGGAPFTVVGVLADRFDFDVEQSFGGVGRHDVWLPPRFPAEARQADGRYLQVVARLARGATVEVAQQEASALAAHLAQIFPDRQRGWDVNVVPLHRDLVGDARPTILVVFGAVCFVLLIACANVANLLMTRASERQQEMAVRAAMGAGRGRLVGQLLAESALLSMTGGMLGALLAHQTMTALIRVAPDIPRIDEMGMDGTVLAFTLVATAGTALLFGLAPALSLARPNLASWLGARGTAGRREGRRLRGSLVVVQVALSLVLLVGAGLLVRSLLNRLDVGVGFELEHLLTTEVQLGGATYEGERQALFFEELVERVRAVPGVRDASAITWPPLAGGGSRTSFWPLDRPVPAPGELPGADVRWVHRAYHGVMGIPLLAGRGFDDTDRAGAPLVVLVNETGADRIWPGESPIGKRIAMPWGDTLVAEVVGVVGDIRHEGPDTDPYPMFYWEHRQFHAFNMMSIVARTEGVESAAVVEGIRTELAELDPGVPLYNVHPMEELFADAVRRARFATMCLGLFALLALVLAAIGIYGVMAHSTEQRSQEIGIRMALGAARPAILGMVVRQGMAHVAVAIAIGAAGALALSRMLGSLVFDVSTADPLTFGAMALLLAATGLLACWLPARRASGIDPVETIRSE
jgi:putative ABC transport system permease protein